MPIFEQDTDINGKPHRITLDTRRMTRQKSAPVAYVLLVFLGLFGGHQFYLGNHGRGVLYLLTMGVFGIGILYDLFALPTQVRVANIPN